MATVELSDPSGSRRSSTAISAGGHVRSSAATPRRILPEVRRTESIAEEAAHLPGRRTIVVAVDRDRQLHAWRRDQRRGQRTGPSAARKQHDPEAVRALSGRCQWHGNAIGAVTYAGGSAAQQLTCAFRLSDGRLSNLPDDVGRLVLRLVVRARLQFREQSQRDELHAGEDQQDAEQQQRPVGDRLIAEQPFVRELRR